MELVFTMLKIVLRNMKVSYKSATRKPNLTAMLF